MTGTLVGVSAVVLAAGASRRFGASKVLARWDGESLVRRTVRMAMHSKVVEVVVVTGYEAEAIAKELQGLGSSDRPVLEVLNDRYREGQSTSVCVGVSAAQAEAALVIPVDQPALTADVLDRLIAAWEEGLGSLVVPFSEGSRRAPVLIDRSLFPDVAELRGDQGMRQLFAERARELSLVAFDEMAPFVDVDTPEDWARLEGFVKSRARS